MTNPLFADLIVIIHFGFILFVIFGGILALKWRNLIWLHLPAAIWGVLIELFGWICPLTYYENSLQRADTGWTRQWSIERWIWWSFCSCSGAGESNEPLNVRRVGSGSRTVDEINDLNDFSIGKSALPTLAEGCYCPNLAKPAYKKEITFKFSKIGVSSWFAFGALLISPYLLSVLQEAQ